ncbi:MAG TPA: glycoside hydrolase domain-containing protein [Stellaceae bacterium]|nr:glycoside hydrolase domain-containing protein [Stellaceae bacterium]
MKLVKPALLLAVLVLTACQGPEVQPTIAQAPQSGYARGIDMATDSSDVAGELQGRPWLQFVARYYRDPASRWPALSSTEAQRLAALGVKIVTVWEWHSSSPAYFTYASGYNDALNATRQARAVGQPPGSAIYFAVDFNARGAALYAVDQYFRGVNAGLAAAGGGRPEYKIGVYGSGAVCAAIKGAGLAQYAWLSGSTAWDGTAGYSAWNIKQAPAAARFAQLSFDHDANEAVNDYGGFQIGNYASASPAAAVLTAAATPPAVAASIVSGAVAAMVPQAAQAAPAAPAMAAVAPPAAQLAVQTAAAPPPPTAAPAAATPVWSASAAEVAKLAAAEPAVSARAVAMPPPVPPPPPEPEARQPAPRMAEQVAHEEPSRGRAAVRSAKGPVVDKRHVHLAVATTRAVAAPPQRHQVAALSGASRAPAQKAAAPRRSDDRTAHAAATRPVERTAQHHVEQSKTEKHRRVGT